MRPSAGARRGYAHEAWINHDEAPKYATLRSAAELARSIVSFPMSSSKHQQEIHEHHIQSDITNHLKVTLSQDGNQQPSISLQNHQQSAFCAPITLPPRKSLSMCFTSNGKALPLPPKKKDIYRPYILQSCEIRTSVEEDLSAAQAILDLSASPAATSHSVFMHSLSSSPLSDLQSQPITMPQQPITIQTSIGVQSVSMNNNSFQRLPKILDTADGSLSNSTAENRTNVYDNSATSITIPTFTNSNKTVAYTYEAFFVSDGRSKKRSNNVTIPEKEINTACKRTKFTCTECGKQYATSSNLSRHKQTHRSLDSQSAKKCIHCGKAYVSMPALAMHVLTHKLAYTCGICGKMFSRPWLLQGHLRSHTGEKPYGCAHCGKAFADRSNLRAHMQTHSSAKHYECSRCHKTFALKSYLNKHLESACPKDGNVSPTQSNTDREKTPTYDQQQYDPVHSYRCL